MARSSHNRNTTKGGCQHSITRYSIQEKKKISTLERTVKGHQMHCALTLRKTSVFPMAYNVLSHVRPCSEHMQNASDLIALLQEKPFKYLSIPTTPTAGFSIPSLPDQPPVANIRVLTLLWHSSVWVNKSNFFKKVLVYRTVTSFNLDYSFITIILDYSSFLVFSQQLYISPT